MPFRSEAQRRYLWAKHPRIARKWTEEARVSKNAPRYGGGGGGVGRRIVDADEPVEKRYRDYDPERRRQRRIGAAEALTGAGGAAAAGYGGKKIVDDTKALRRSARKHGKGGAFLKPKSTAIAAGGVAGLAAVPMIRRWSESNRGRPWGS